jgi:hypothetical protein
MKNLLTYKSIDKNLVIYISLHGSLVERQLSFRWGACSNPGKAIRGGRVFWNRIFAENAPKLWKKFAKT